MTFTVEHIEGQKTTTFLKKSAKKLILVLGILLAVCLGCLAARIVQLSGEAGWETVIIPDNLIAEEALAAGWDTNPAASRLHGPQAAEIEDEMDVEATLSLYKLHPSDNERFEVLNMLPGDSETKYFCVKIKHKQPVVLYFSAEITDELKDLGDVLNIRVEHLETATVLYEGSFSGAQGLEFPELIPDNDSGETIAYYRIDAELPTSVGNEYQRAMLEADLHWYIKFVDEGEDPPIIPPLPGGDDGPGGEVTPPGGDDGPGGEVTPPGGDDGPGGEVTPPGGGDIDSPQTGDSSQALLWAVLAGVSFLSILLLILRRKKEASQNE